MCSWVEKENLKALFKNNKSTKMQFTPKHLLEYLCIHHLCEMKALCLNIPFIKWHILKLNYSYIMCNRTAQILATETICKIAFYCLACRQNYSLTTECPASAVITSRPATKDRIGQCRGWKASGPCEQILLHQY